MRAVTSRTLYTDGHGIPVGPATDLEYGLLLGTTPPGQRDRAAIEAASIDFPVELARYRMPEEDE